VAFRIKSEMTFPRGTRRWRDRSFALAKASGSRFTVVLILKSYSITHQMSSISIYALLVIPLIEAGLIVTEFYILIAAWQRKRLSKLAASPLGSFG
jgi:hypothetical protein